MRVPWTARRSNQTILKEMNPEYSLKGLMLKLKLHCSGHLMRRANSLEKTLKLGKIEGRRRKWQQRTRWLDGFAVNGHEFEQTQGDSEGQGSLACYSTWESQRVGHDLVNEQQIRIQNERMRNVCSGKYLLVYEALCVPVCMCAPLLSCV